MRLQKWMAHCGVASRRKSEEIIKEGRVLLNGEIVREMGRVIDPETDIVIVDGKELEKKEKKQYIAFHKPLYVITSTSDTRGRKTVLDYIPIEERIYPVGRLDFDSSGLLLLTNDGDLAYKLTHPKFEVKKSYIALVEGRPSIEKIKELEQGVLIDDIKTYPAKVKVLEEDSNKTLIEITIHEGRNRQVRKMFDAISHPVIELTRISFGPIKLEPLYPGEYRKLSKEEIKSLLDATKRNKKHS